MRTVPEIDENLIRNELSPSQKAKHLKRRQEIWEGLNSGRISSETPGRPTGFAGDTEKTTGIRRQRINENLARANALGDDLDAISGTSLDKGVEMDARGREPPN
ncbi:MAG: hypothetical protein GC201_16420 [Alphaproteobacteria bacterium]|nr:hypothetical protein [Alphaproteobacteria bacterium]